MELEKSLSIRQERTELIRKATRWEKVEKIPHFSMFQLWQVFDSDTHCTLSEAMKDYDLMERIVREHQERYNFDFLDNTGVRNPFLVYEALECKSYNIDDDNEAINHVDQWYCEHDELEEMAADYWKFIWEKGMAKKYEWWTDPERSFDIIQNAINARNEYFAFVGKISKVCKEEYGLPSYCRPVMPPMIPIENIFSYVRGFKGMALDMRREPTKLDALLDTLADMNFHPALEGIKKLEPGMDMSVCWDFATTMLCQNFMNLKQWDKYYWPLFKQFIDVIESKAMTFSIFTEGAIMRFKDYFNDYKKGTLTFMLEMDDPFEFRKEFPKCAILGGMDNVLLGGGTKEECLNLAKRLCEELGGEGGYLMTQTKIGTFRADGKRENVLAVSEFVQNYRC